MGLCFHSGCKTINLWYRWTFTSKKPAEVSAWEKTLLVNYPVSHTSHFPPSCMALVTCLWVPLQIYDQTRERDWLKSDREVLAKEEVLNALGTGRHAASLVSLTAALTDTMEMISLAKICDTYPEANTLSHTRFCRREHTHRNTHILVPRRWHILHGDRALHIAPCTHTSSHSSHPAAFGWVSFLESELRAAAAFRGHLLG